MNLTTTKKVFLKLTEEEAQTLRNASDILKTIKQLVEKWRELPEEVTTIATDGWRICDLYDSFSSYEDIIDLLYNLYAFRDKLELQQPYWGALLPFDKKYKKRYNK